MIELDVMLWAFLQNYHQDKANAAVNCAPTKFRPLTLRLGQVLLNRWPEGEDITQEVLEVRHHLTSLEGKPG